MGNVTYLDILRQSNYRRLIIANIINRLGDAIDTLAFSWIVYAFTGEGMWAAIVFDGSVVRIPFPEFRHGVYVFPIALFFLWCCSFFL